MLASILQHSCQAKASSEYATRKAPCVWNSPSLRLLKDNRILQTCCTYLAHLREAPQRSYIGSSASVPPVRWLADIVSSKTLCVFKAGLAFNAIAMAKDVSYRIESES
eukprot:661293-Amphidinium_carterae.1